MAKRAHGIDISVWQGSFNPPDAIKSEIDFVVLKASQGIGQDNKFESFYSTALNFPLRGAYHYFETLNTKTSRLLNESAKRKREIKESKVVTVFVNGLARQIPEVLINSFNKEGVGWKEQADFFIETVKDKDFQFFALDIEEGPNPKKNIGGSRNLFSNADVGNMEKWINHVKEQTGKPVVLYTRALILRDQLIPKGGENLKGMDLWIAWYADNVDRENDNPFKEYSIPGVTNWHFWQYSADKNQKGADYGVKSSGIDLDVFNGSIDDMKAWLAGATIETTTTVVEEPEASTPPGETEMATSVEQPTDMITAQLDKMIAAGITPSVQININSTDFDIEKLTSLKAALEEASIAADVNITLDLSSTARAPLPTPPPKKTQETKIDTPPDQDIPTPALEESFQVRALSKKKPFTALYTFRKKDDAGKPIMDKTSPVIRIPNNTLFSVSATHKAGAKDKGDGKIMATGGQIYYYITAYPNNKDQVGKYVLRSEVKRV
jgi:GH25 family lysozyme M1 (1,4-beta-N-acetylmuramidase)